MDQLANLGINLTWLLTQIINVFIVLLILRLLAFKPILNMFESRKKKIQESLEYADKVKAEAAQQQSEFDRKLEQARRESSQAAELAQAAAQKEREAILAQARDDAQKIVEQAKGQIEYERTQMLSEVRAQVVSLSLLATQKVIGQSLDESRQRKLIDDFLSKTPELGKN